MPSLWIPQTQPPFCSPAPGTALATGSQSSPRSPAGSRRDNLWEIPNLRQAGEKIVRQAAARDPGALPFSTWSRLAFCRLPRALATGPFDCSPWASERKHNTGSEKNCPAPVTLSPLPFPSHSPSPRRPFRCVTQSPEPLRALSLTDLQLVQDWPWVKGTAKQKIKHYVQSSNTQTAPCCSEHVLCNPERVFRLGFKHLQAFPYLVKK